MACWFLLLVIVGSSMATYPVEDHRQEKLLGLGLPKLFGVKPYECNLKDNLGLGTCYTLIDCLKKKGTAHGKCAGIFGVCCKVDVETEGNTTISANGGTFSGSSSSGRSLDARESRTNEGETVVAVLKPSSDKVQMLLEFTMFDIMGPTEGECDNDTFIITGYTGRQQVPILCGENTGKHMYIDLTNYDSSADDMTLEFSFSTNDTDRKFEIEVSFLDTMMTPHPSCLQYFSETSGSISSFNYGTTPEHLNNQLYSICFAVIPEYCDIGFTFNTLDLGNTMGDCMEDFVHLQSMSLCGSETDYSVTGNATTTITLMVSSDGANTDGVEGFEIDYTMMEC